MQISNCKICNIKIVDTGYRPEKRHDECADCEAAKVTPQLVEFIVPENHEAYDPTIKFDHVSAAI